MNPTSLFSRPRTYSGTLTCLMRAAAIGHAERVEDLLRKGVDPNEKGPRNSTAIMFAAGGGHLDVVKILMEKGADPTATEEGGWDALMHAEVDGHREVASLIRQYVH